MGEGGSEVSPLPFHRFEIDSPMRPDVALNVMRAHIEKPSFFRLRWPSATNDKRFDGDITGDGFDVMRIMGYNNSFTPRVLGRVQPTGVGSRIRVTMRLHISTMVVLIGASAFLAAVAPWETLPISFIALYGLMWIGFWFEARKQEKALREIFRETTRVVS